jgi:elongation factor P
LTDAPNIARGDFLVLDGTPWKVLDAVQDASGPVHATLRCVATGVEAVRHFRHDARLERAGVETREAQYLYAEDRLHHFMDTQSYEQCVLDAALLADALPFVRENDTVRLELLDGRPVGVALPPSVELEVSVTAPGARDELAASVYKDATLETGMTIRVPLFVEMGERVRVDTRTGRFLERVP